MPRSAFPKLVITIVVILAAVGVGYAGWMIWRDRMSTEPMDGKLVSEEEPAEEVEPRIEPSSPLEPATAKVDTSGWKTYRGGDLGFEIKYPAFLKLQTKVPCRAPIVNREEEKFRSEDGVFFEHEFDYAHGTFIDLWIFICVVEENYETLANYHFGAPDPVAISGRQGYKIERGAEESAGEIYYFEHSRNTTLMVHFGFFREIYASTLAEEQEEYIDFAQQKVISQQILSTLRFVDN